MEKISYEKLSLIEQKLLTEAEKAMFKAYSPYSKFCVGAALLTQDDQIIIGANVENAAYSHCVCAERSALVKANAEGHRKFKALAVIARSLDFDTEELTAPCGSCRQMLYEASQLSEVDLKVILSTTQKDKIAITSVNELLPYAFGPKDLGINIQEY
jgi:cytidine deaminase